jgi:hypothetical protein
VTTTSSHERQKEKRDTYAARGQGNTHTRGKQTLGDKKAKERRRIGKVNERDKMETVHKSDSSNLRRQEG